MNGIVLVGFMGTGKTVVGRSLAQRLGIKFLDVDDLIEEKLGMSIEDIFERCGEPYFRKVEKEVVAQISKNDNCVVATGGGAVVDIENVINLKSMGRMIHLVARPDVILTRIQGENNRPLLKTGHRHRRIAALLTKRASFYATADHEIDTSELGIEDVVEKILRYLQEPIHG
jgi:shikimate kinase